MGVETVIVCSPPDVTVFLDNKELAPTSYGRYVIPHLHASHICSEYSAPDLPTQLSGWIFQ